MKKKNLISTEYYRERKAAREATKAFFEQSEYKSQIPRMPRGLNSQEKIWWKRMMKKLDKSILLPCDAMALRLLVEALADYDRAKKDYEESGRPSVYKEILQDLRAQISQGLESFLLTPECLIKEGWLEGVGRKKNIWPRYKKNRNQEADI